MKSIRWKWVAIAAAVLAGSARAASVSVRWDANTESDLAGYKLYYGNASLMSMTPDQAAASGSVTKVDTGKTAGAVLSLSAGSTYYFRVTAYNTGNEESAFSASPPEISTYVASTPPPPAPSGLTATSTSSSVVHLTWADVAGETSYVVQYSLSASFSAPLFQPASANATSIDIGSLQAGTLYYFHILARNSGGDSAYSATKSATTLAAGGGSGGGGSGGGSGGGVTPQGIPVGQPLFVSPWTKDGINDTVDFGANAARIDVFDAHGRRFFQGTGRVWDGKDERGGVAPTGVYLVKITAKDGSIKFQKLVVVK